MSINNIVSTLGLSTQLEIDASGNLNVRLDAAGSLASSSNGLGVYINPAVPGGLISSEADGLTFDPSFLFNISGIIISASDFMGEYAAPIEIIPSVPSGRYISVDRYELTSTYGTTQFTGGGQIALQYGNTAHGAGLPASEPLASALLTGMVADSIFRINGAITPGMSPTNAGIFLSNDTAPFADGDSDFTMSIWYKVVVY